MPFTIKSHYQIDLPTLCLGLLESGHWTKINFINFWCISGFYTLQQSCLFLTDETIGEKIAELHNYWKIILLLFRVNFCFKCVLIEPARGPGHTSECFGPLTAAALHSILMVIKGGNLGEGYKCSGANF